MVMSNFVYFGFFKTKHSLVWLLTGIVIFTSLYFTISKVQLAMGSGERIVSVDFEVFGKVQAVFFRKYTEQEAKRLELKGWCMNTRQNTVKGVIEGIPSSVNQMKLWLQKTGSPSSRIDKAVFTNEKDIKEHTYDNFRIKR